MNRSARRPTGTGRGLALLSLQRGKPCTSCFAREAHNRRKRGPRRARGPCTWPRTTSRGPVGRDPGQPFRRWTCRHRPRRKQLRPPQGPQDAGASERSFELFASFSGGQRRSAAAGSRRFPLHVSIVEHAPAHAQASHTAKAGAVHRLGTTAGRGRARVVRGARRGPICKRNEVERRIWEEPEGAPARPSPR